MTSRTMRGNPCQKPEGWLGRFVLWNMRSRAKDGFVLSAENLCESTARLGCNQKHDTEEAEEAEDLGVVRHGKKHLAPQ